MPAGRKPLGPMEKLQRYDPLTLQMAETLLKFKAAGGGTKEERDASRKALAQVRFLKTAYRLFWKTKYDPKLAPHRTSKENLTRSSKRSKRRKTNSNPS